MFDILSSPSTKPQEQSLLNVNFETAALGDTMIYDQATGRPFFRNGTDQGQVVDDPTMGRCFKFNGTGGFSFDTNQSVPIVGKKVKFLIDYKCDDTAQRVLLYTGLNHIVHVPGWCLLNNIPGWGELFWVDNNVAAYRTGAGAIGTARKQMEMRTGLPDYGTKIMIQGQAASGIGIQPAINPMNGPTLYIASADPRHNNVYPGFKGLLKSFRMIEIP